MTKKNKKQNLSVFAVPCDPKTAHIQITPVSWDVTTSYGGGTSDGPAAIFAASSQVDLYDIHFGETYTRGYYWGKEDPWFKKENKKMRPQAKKVIRALEKSSDLPKAIENVRSAINKSTHKMVDMVYQKTVAVLSSGKIPGLVGGDHSTPLGAINAVVEHHQGQVGVLHIDAHADLRYQYHGFVHSHASIMRNVCESNHKPKKLVQVGIRDFCLEEKEFIEQNNGLIKTYFDADLKRRQFDGQTWTAIASEIVNHLPQKVYISFDIDGLSPDFCPNTGTPVPGGITFDQAVHLLVELAKQKKQIVGFDLNEVAPGADSEWDANVGARMLFKLCGLACT